MLVTLACNLDVNALSVKKLKKVVHDNIAELVPALTSGLSFYSESARYAEDSLEILDIVQQGDSDYSMSYRISGAFLMPAWISTAKISSTTASGFE